MTNLDEGIGLSLKRIGSYILVIHIDGGGGGGGTWQTHKQRRRILLQPHPHSYWRVYHKCGLMDLSHHHNYYSVNKLCLVYNLHVIAMS